MIRTRRSVWYCLLLVLLTVPTAHAAKSRETLKDYRPDGVAQPMEAVKEFRPVSFAGIPLSMLEGGNFMCFSWNYPREHVAFSELAPERVSYNAHVVGPEGEYIAYAVMPTVAGDVPYWRFTGVVGGIRTLKPGMKGVTHSTMLDKAYRLSGEEIVEYVPGKWADGDYRRDFVRKYGTPLDETPVSEIAKQEISRWNVYETEVGLLASPWDEGQVRRIAEINPAYSGLGKIVKAGNFRLTPSLTSIFTGIAMDVISALGQKPCGYDAKSVMSREQLGKTVLFIDANYREYFRKHNRNN